MWNAISLVQVWTHVAVSNSYNDNHYTTGVFNKWRERETNNDVVSTIPFSQTLQNNVSQFAALKALYIKMHFLYMTWIHIRRPDINNNITQNYENNITFFISCFNKS